MYQTLKNSLISQKTIKKKSVTPVYFIELLVKQNVQCTCVQWIINLRL